jgi:uridine kinase
MINPIIIGVAGGSGSGKTTFAEELSNRLNSNTQTHSQIIKQDNYYHDQSDKFDHDGGNVNFDHPESIDFNFMVRQLSDLKKNIEINIPIYDFATHSRKKDTIPSKPTKIILIDGILLYTCKPLNSILDYKLFVDCPEEIRYSRRLKRDISERGRTEEGVKAQFHTQVKPMHDLYVEPSKGLSCDIINIENFEKKLSEWTIKIRSLL